MSERPELTFVRYDAAGARAVRATVAAIHQDAYAAAIASGDRFDSVEAFMTRFESYTGRGNSGFELVVAYSGEGEPVGQSWGWPLGPPRLGGQGWSASLNPTSPSRTAPARSPCRRSWSGRHGPAAASPMPCTTRS